MRTEDEAERLSIEINALKDQLLEQEADWASWRQGHINLSSQSRKDGLQVLRDQIYKMQARLDRLER